MKLPRRRLCVTGSLFVSLACVSVGCDRLEEPVKSADSTAVVHDGNRITVPSKSPLASRLEVAAAQTTTIHRQVTAPASVEADPARYARILPPLNGRVLQLFVHPGDSVVKGQELLAIDAPDFVGAQTDYTNCLLYTSPSPRDRG